MALTKIVKRKSETRTLTEVGRFVDVNEENTRVRLEDPNGRQDRERRQ